MLNRGELSVRVPEGYAPENSCQINAERERVLAIMARADEIACAADTSVMVQGIIDLIIEVTQADSANFFQLDTAADELVITHVCGEMESQHLVGLRLNCQQGLPGISLVETKIMVIGDLLSDPDWMRAADPVNAARKKNVINLPIAHKEHTLGAIQIFNFQQAELDILMVLGNRLGFEIERRRQIDAVQRSNQRLLALVDVLGEVAGTLDRNQLLHLVTENAALLVDAERSSLFLVDPNTREMIFQVSYQPPVEGQVPPSSEKVNRLARFSSSMNQFQAGSTQQARTNYFHEGEFSYFNRYAITAPLQSEPLSQDQAGENKHLLGGLMVLNKPNASFEVEDAHLMRILANQASTFLQVAEMYESSGELFLGVIKSLITAIDAYDPYTQGHSLRVSEYSVQIARELGIEEPLVNDLRIGSLLHDIGKIGIPDSILLKKVKLSQKEMELVREHPRIGVNILSQVRLLEPMCPAILEHHERLDGSGYPAKLIDKQISWMGRIVAVADVFDAMTSKRPYRDSLSVQEVLDHLNKNAGILFDAACVQAMQTIITRSDQGNLENSAHPLDQ
jgi:putative nucleotidyltransferase with HDIG domain